MNATIVINVKRYLRKPERPYYETTVDASDQQTYLDIQEVKSLATAAYSGTLTSPGTTTLIVSEPGPTDLFTLGTYDYGSGESMANIAYGISADVNRNINQHGYSAVVSGTTARIYAPVGSGIAPNTGEGDYTLVTSSTATGAGISGVFSAFNSGVAGSTQIDVDDVYHTDIAMRVLGYLGVSLRENQVLEYIGKLNNPDAS